MKRLCGQLLVISVMTMICASFYFYGKQLIVWIEIVGFAVAVGQFIRKKPVPAARSFLLVGALYSLSVLIYGIPNYMGDRWLQILTSGVVSVALVIAACNLPADN